MARKPKTKKTKEGSPKAEKDGVPLTLGTATVRNGAVFAGASIVCVVVWIAPFAVRMYRAPQEEYARQQGLRGTAMPEVINYSYGARERLRWPLNDVLWTPWIRCYPPGRRVEWTAPGWMEIQFRLDAGEIKTLRTDSSKNNLGEAPSNEFRIRGTPGTLEIWME